ncbi:restriction endonuclease subunit S [Novacetimonas sp. GS1]|uniref:restriction endonuclease subunit S n=1 Tax=Novacetimonas sp. GS1 TaxID=3119990 RepID=UPI002FCCDF99
MSFPKYPAYKDSGVEWIGDIPVGWEITPLKTVASISTSNVDKKSYNGEHSVYLCNYVDVFYNNDITSDIKFMQATASKKQIETFSLITDDVLITKDSESAEEIAIPAYIPHHLDNTLCGYHLAILRSNRRLSGRFLFWFFLSAALKFEVKCKANGLTRVGLSQYALNNIVFPLPPLPEQQAIASFLDRECGKIDALIAEQERLIALLAEKRQAVISHAVTKGLTPNAPMKDSGIPWIGMVPEGWEILSLNKVVRNFIDYRGVTPNKVESGIPLITASCIKHGRIDHSIDPVFITEKEYNRRMTRGFPRAGDVILTTEAPLGEVAIVEDALISPGQRMILFKLHESMSNFYMKLYYLSDIGRQELRSRASGSTASGIRADRLRASAIPVPPLNEQKEICAYIDRKTSTFESLEQQIRYELDILKERRAALISAAVTGKIDVRAQSKARAA